MNNVIVDFIGCNTNILSDIMQGEVSETVYTPSLLSFRKVVRVYPWLFVVRRTVGVT